MCSLDTFLILSFLGRQNSSTDFRIPSAEDTVAQILEFLRYFYYKKNVYYKCKKSVDKHKFCVENEISNTKSYVEKMSLKKIFPTQKRFC